jgi:riboflavin synthase
MLKMLKNDANVLKMYFWIFNVFRYFWIFLKIYQNMGQKLGSNITNEDFTVGLSPETLRKTSLIELKTGSLVNLERAVQPDSRMGGHFVQGHVDGTGMIVEKEPEGDSLWIKVKADKGLLKYIVPKGFIAVDGTSLTVVDVMEEEECFNFMLVAYTQQKVVVPLKEVGQKVNLEVDILGKYVERLLSSGFVDSFKGSS